MNPSLVRLERGDAPALLALSESIGWPHTLEDAETALDCGQTFGHRDAGGGLLSCAVIYSYGPGLAALAQVIVRDDARRRGLGRTVVARCIEAAGSVPVMLVATPEGFPLYASLGFRTVDNIIRLTRETDVHGAPLFPAGASRPMEEADLARVLALDRLAYAADRTCVLRSRWRRSSGVRRGEGFGWRLRRRERWLIGPVIATAASDAEAMIADLAAGLTEPLQIEIPESQAALIARLSERGFERAAERPLMLHGADKLPGRRERIFALATLAHC